MSLFSRHSLLLQTTYSELKRRAEEQPLLLVGTPGSVGERTVGGGKFWYRQYYDPQGKKTADYLGAVGDAAAETKAAATREAIVTANALIAEARELARHGDARVDPRTGAILTALANHGLFRAGALLVGSHAYGALLAELGVRARSGGRISSKRRSSSRCSRKVRRTRSRMRSTRFRAGGSRNYEPPRRAFWSF